MKLTLQAARFLVVGVFTNACLYVAYLYITWKGLDHKLAMTIAYMTGVLMSFALNRNWTFRHNGSVSSGFVRYVLIYFFGYFIDLAGLYLLVDMAGYPHQIIQLMIAVLLAAMFFVLQRVWVFQKTERITV